MNIGKLGKLTEIKDLRTIWKDESKDFTPWLAKEENLQILSEALGIDIVIEEQESLVGSFSVDLFGNEVDTNRKVIIENQLDDTNHDHLGKLITYASGKNAQIIVWIVKAARDEHKSAIEWLNNHTDDDIGFFLCEIKLLQIDNSDPAVKFEVIEKPNDWSKEIKKDLSQRHFDRYEYWTKFNKFAFDTENTFAVSFRKKYKRRKPSHDHWLNYSLGSSQYHVATLYFIQKSQIGCEFYIDDNKEIFDYMFKHKEEIENKSGLKFEWNRIDNKKACRIIILKDCNVRDKNDWENQFSWLCDTMVRMKESMLKFAQEIAN